MQFYQVANFNCTILNNTIQIFTPSKNFVVVGLCAELTSVSGYVSSTNVNISCGQEATTYQNSGGTVTLTTLQNQGDNVVALRTTGAFTTQIAGIPIFARVRTAAANATTYVCKVTVMGFYT